MLFFPEFLPEKNDPDKKKINGAANRRMLFNCLPCLFHFPAPVYIIKNKNRIIGSLLQQLVEITQRGLQPVIAINEGEVHGRQFTNNSRKCIIEVSFLQKPMLQF